METVSPLRLTDSASLRPPRNTADTSSRSPGRIRRSRAEPRTSIRWIPLEETASVASFPRVNHRPTPLLARALINTITPSRIKNNPASFFIKSPLQSVMIPLYLKTPRKNPQREGTSGGRPMRPAHPIIRKKGSRFSPTDPRRGKTRRKTGPPAICQPTAAFPSMPGHLTSVRLRGSGAAGAHLRQFLFHFVGICKVGFSGIFSRMGIGLEFHLRDPLFHPLKTSDRAFGIDLVQGRVDALFGFGRVGPRDQSILLVPKLLILLLQPAQLFLELPNLSGGLVGACPVLVGPGLPMLHLGEGFSSQLLFPGLQRLLRLHLATGRHPERLLRLPFKALRHHLMPDDGILRLVDLGFHIPEILFDHRPRIFQMIQHFMHRRDNNVPHPFDHRQFPFLPSIVFLVPLQEAFPFAFKVVFPPGLLTGRLRFHARFPLKTRRLPSLTDQHPTEIDADGRDQQPDQERNPVAQQYPADNQRPDPDRPAAARFRLLPLSPAVC